jgi:lipopolysaccharide transport system permease protein
MRPVTVIEPPSIRGVHPARALQRLLQFSDLFWVLTRHRVKVRYQHTHLGGLWAVLQPLTLMLVFALMFSVLGRTPGGTVPYALFAYAALVPWTAFASGLSSASGSLTGHASLLTKVSFPREILPLTYVAAALVELSAALIPLVALMAWYRVTPTVHLIWIVPAVIVMSLFMTAAGLLLSALNARYRDVGTAMPVVLQVWMFATPVIYPLAAAKSALEPGMYALYSMNPMAAVVDTFRQAVLGYGPDLVALARALLVTLALLPIAFTYFKLQDTVLADVV